MAEYDMRRGVIDGPLGEDVPIDSGEVRDRGFFGPHRRDYYDEADAYASEIGAGGYGRRPGGVYEGGLDGGYGGGYYGPSRPPMGYEDGVYGGGYGPLPPVVGEASDLGMGLVDSNIRTTPDYGSSLTRPDFAGVPVDAYELERAGRHHHGHHGGYGAHDEADFEEERRHKRYAEAAAAAALGYGLHERHERKEAEERLEELGYDGRRRDHHLFRSDS